MALKVLIVPDKFKGTLTARAAAHAIADGWHSARPKDKLDLLPMSDGGDGFGEVMSGLLGAKALTVQTVDAAHRPCRARWWWASKTRTAIIESAGIIGLAHLPPKKYHPFELDTFGLGKVLQAAAAKGARNCLIGIGGSATNDGGFGVARAMGWEFRDRAGNDITAWPELYMLSKLRLPQRKRWFDKLIVAVDVQNVLLGARGCTRIYGPQKGLAPGDFPAAERSLRRLAVIARKKVGGDCGKEPGAGAAGGLGFGLLRFLGAQLRPGFDLFAHLAELGRRIRSVDLVITGEGAIDESTLMGKGVGQIAHWCSRLRKPCVGLAGAVTARTGRLKGFTRARGLINLTTLERAKAKPAVWLERLAAEIARDWQEH